MRFITLMILFCWGQSACSQTKYYYYLNAIPIDTATAYRIPIGRVDSVYLKVTKVKGNKYWLKDTTGQKYKTKCDCKHEVGEVVAVTIKDLFKPKK